MKLLLWSGMLKTIPTACGRGTALVSKTLPKLNIFIGFYSISRSHGIVVWDGEILVFGRCIGRFFWSILAA